MRYFTADALFDGYRFRDMHEVLCVHDDGSIAGFETEIDDVLVKHLPGLLMPGMINAHCHLELSAFAGVIPQHTGLVNFLMQINSKRFGFAKEEISQAIANAEAQMISNGIIAVGDISNGLDSLAQKKQANLHYHTFVECVGLLDANAEERFLSAVRIQQSFAEIHPSTVVLHAPYSVSKTLRTLVNQYGAGKPSSIHNQECEAENEIFLSGTGDFLQLFMSVLQDTSFFIPTHKHSLPSYLSDLRDPDPLLLVHNTVSTAADIEFAQANHKNVFWCLCPLANLYIENRLPDVQLLHDSGCKMVIGTDSLASNTSLNLWNEIKTLQHHFPSIRTEEVLRWVTSNASQSLSMQHKLGSFESGKMPGLLHIKNYQAQEGIPENPICEWLLKH